MQMTTIGIDLAKIVFQVHAVEPRRDGGLANVSDGPRCSRSCPVTIRA